MSPAEFVAAFGPYADAVAAQTGLNRWSILTQWALETGWNDPSSTAWFNNLAGITYHGIYSDVNGFTAYPNLDAFVTDYIGVLKQPNMAVIFTDGGGGIHDQLIAFGKSPWAGSHYDNGGGPGSSLLALYNSAFAPLAGPSSPPPAPSGAPSPSSDSGGLAVSDRDFLYAELVKLAHAMGATLDTPPWAAADTRTYTVKPGDSLWEIAAQYLGDGKRYPEIYNLNKDLIGPDPNVIHPGQVLTLPNS